MEAVARPRLRSVLKVLALAVGVLILVPVAWALVLAWQNPEPSPSPGWSSIRAMPGPRGEVAAAGLEHRLVVAGGFSGVWTTSDAVATYHLGRELWEEGPPLPDGRHHAAAASLDGAVYVSGGADSVLDWDPHDDLWRLVDGEWEELEPMPEGRQGHAMVALGGRLYVVGGVGETSRVLVYDPEDGWTTGPEMPEPRDHLRAVAFRDEVWALGGRVNDVPVERVDVYDPDREQWRRAPSLLEPMSAMAVGVLSDGIHVVGGEDPAAFGGGVISGHVVFGSDGWQPAPEGLLAVHGAGGAAIDDRLFVAGGASRQGPLSAISYTDLTQVYDPEDQEEEDP